MYHMKIILSEKETDVKEVLFDEGSIRLKAEKLEVLLKPLSSFRPKPRQSGA